MLSESDERVKDFWSLRNGKLIVKGDDKKKYFALTLRCFCIVK